VFYSPFRCYSFVWYLNRQFTFDKLWTTKRQQQLAVLQAWSSKHQGPTRLKKTSVAADSGTSTKSVDQVDQSFMYIQILKETLLTIDFERVRFNGFITYYREQSVGNNFELKNVDKLEGEYRSHQPIWWYTYNCFLYPMLNRALRTMEVDLIIKMGFFVRDLYEHLAQLHSK
jgi:hypothetical protein